MKVQWQVTTSYINAVNTTPNVAFTHDPFYPRVKSMTDGVGTTSYDYVDAAANGALSLQQECFVATGQSTCSHTIDYVYDDLNRLAGRTIQGSGPETLSYDAINRVIRHTNDLGAFDISYLGQTSQIARSKLDAPGANLETTWSYLNNLGDRRLSAISNKGLADGQFTDFAFTTSPENLITGITQNSDATVEIPNPPTQTVSFNELNEITSVSGQAYTYDANGNLLSDGTRTYSWDAENRLIGVTFAGDPGRTVTYAYDGIGRRIAIEDAPGTSAVALRKFVWCGSSLCQARDANYAVDRSYHEEGEAVASEGGLYYGRDQIGSVRRIFKTSTEAPAIDYDPYGVKLQNSPLETDFGFARLFGTDPSGNYLTWYRVADSERGVWISRDPLGEGTEPTGNLYTYASANPLGTVDELGLFPRPSANNPSCSANVPKGPDGTPVDPASKKKSPTFFCEHCGAPHGGLYSPYCPDCYKKSQKPESGIPPINKPDWETED